MKKKKKKHSAIFLKIDFVKDWSDLCFTRDKNLRDCNWSLGNNQSLKGKKNNKKLWISMKE
jgi:hypothetical protein